MQGGGVEPSLDARHPFDEPSGDGRRGFKCRVGHHVRDARILVVADAREDRQGKLGDVGAEAVGIETVQVAGRPAAPDQYDRIEIVHAVGHGVECRHDRILGTGALHESVEKRQGESIGTFAQLLAEILIARCLAARNDGDTLYYLRQRIFAVDVPDSFALEPLDGDLPLSLHVAQREGRVDVQDVERETVQFVVGDHHPGQDADACGQSLTRFGLEIAGDAGVSRAPDDRPGLRERHAVVATLFDQFEVAMPRIVDLDLRDFGTDPYGQGERFVERRFDELLELGECQVVLHDDKDSESREKTGTCSQFSEAPPIFCEDSERQG